MPNSSRKWIVRFAALLAIVGFVAVGYWAFTKFLPNFFDREIVNAGEIDKLKSVDLSRKNEQTTETESWPQFRGPMRDGWASPKSFNTDWTSHKPKVKWSVPCGGGYSSMAVVDGVIYTMDKQGGDERLLALDAETGSLLWDVRTPADYSSFKAGYASGPRSTPTVHEGRIYTVGATGVMKCLILQGEGKKPPQLAWEKQLVAEFGASLAEWGMACSPLIEGDLVIVQPGGKKGSVVAFNRLTGDLVWAAGKDPNGYSSPIAATFEGVRQIIAVTGTSILGIRANDGELLWRHVFKTSFDGNIAMPVIAGEYVFVSSGYNKGCVCLRVDGSSAKVVYFRPNKLMRTHHSTCVHKDGFLYGFDDERLACVNLREGTAVEDWPSPDVGGRIKKGSLLLVGDHLLGLTQTGTLFLMNADPKDGSLLGRIDGVLSGSECWALPVVLNGKIYLRDGEKVVCLE